MGTVGTLNSTVRRLLILAQSETDAEGWCKISKAVWPLVKNIPAEFFEIKPSEGGGGYIKLTELGDSYVNWM